MEFQQAQIKSCEIEQKITEEDVIGLISNFSRYVITRNIPECKKFIQDFVKDVVVYKEHIELIFNVSFVFGKPLAMQVCSDKL